MFSRPVQQQQQAQYTVQKVIFVDDRGRVVKVEERLVQIRR